jgi:hypothetical protein
MCANEHLALICICVRDPILIPTKVNIDIAAMFMVASASVCSRSTDRPSGGIIMATHAFKTCIGISICILLTGCISTMRGTPDRPFKVDQIVVGNNITVAVQSLSTGSLDGPVCKGALAAMYPSGSDRSASTSLRMTQQRMIGTDFDGSDCKTIRNRQVSLLLSAVDANYYEFRKDLFANSRHSAAGSGALTLLMTIAGGLTGSAGVKQHYLLGTNLVNGISTQFDKSYLYEKNIASLVATMDGERDALLSRILDSMDEVDYRGQSALLDVYKYFVAGTLENAVTSLERQARQKADDSALLLRNERHRNRVLQLESDGAVERMRLDERNAP